MAPPFQIFGVLNCTPDSFYDGGHRSSVASSIDFALQLEREGADVLDIGGESSRPGAMPITFAEELARVEPVIAGIRRLSNIPISLDTTKYEVAKFLLEKYSIQYLNDVSGFRQNSEMIQLALKHPLKLIVMHSQGTPPVGTTPVKNPETMAGLTHYENLVPDICAELTESLQLILAQGVARDQIILDPGFGFAKTIPQNIEVLAKLEELKKLGFPVLVGMSRKSFIGALLGEPRPADRLYGSLSATLIAASKGILLHRVHDVKATKDVLKVYEGIT